MYWYILFSEYLLTGLGVGLLEEGETGISATNRNYTGRMGSPHATTYLASPAIVAASAINGYISGPKEWGSYSYAKKLKASVKPFMQQTIEKTQERQTQVYPGFEGIISGELVFCNKDNLNTDGIYPGKYTYDDDISPEKMAKVVMENYDTEFSCLIKKNDILISGYNFGTGSSREQAATALKYAGINLVLAGSFSETFKRNAINNGLLALECPEMVDYLRNENRNLRSLTCRTGLNVLVDLISGKIKHGNQFYQIPSVGYSVQEILVNGGLESWIKKSIKSA